MPGVGNFILASLSVIEHAQLLNDLEHVALQAGDVLQNAGELQYSIYFPTSCIISLLSTTCDGESTELAMVGNEGLGGISPVLGDPVAHHQLVVQSAGHAYRLEAGIMQWELAQGGRLQNLALRYASALLAQIGQNLICANHHTMEQRLCRWLLLCQDRQPDRVISMTQDRLAGLLGVRREMVAIGAGRLQAAGLIAYHRGKIRLVDRAALEAAACECHTIITAEYARYSRGATENNPLSHFRSHRASLRQSALARWRELPVVAEDPAESAHMRHELEISKIELEISNEALHEAIAVAETLSERYADIYDFAPVAYFTLDAACGILDLNLAGAILLGLKRSQKSRQGFASYLAKESRESFRRFVSLVVHEKTRQGCEIVLAATPMRQAATVRIEAVPDEDGKECRMVVLDITEQRALLQALEHSEIRLRRFIETLPGGQGLANRPPEKAR
ncbi:MAG: Crp/Fnr family transcriptional regulator [Dechloromonas sp.]|nr:MAG: Crp/Fnr family transcriptional regulator [Dechloromonas sp.]